MQNVKDEPCVMIPMRHYEGLVAQATKYDCMTRLLEQMSIVGDDVPIDDINALLQTMGEDTFTGKAHDDDDLGLLEGEDDPDPECGLLFETKAEEDW